jgi:hypothetical protein
MSMLASRKKGTLFGKPKGEVIKHPGALTAEAKASGRSKLEQAEVDSHSSDPSKRGRGLLGIRFIKRKI